ncbi:hypothetical protein PTKIN_Ptkin03bG0013700 [Pterospermum kingtungense]
MGKKKAGGGENKEKGSTTVVLKFDCLCKGCATKINKHIGDFEGVEIDVGSNKVTVVGAVDSTAIRERLLKKIKKKVELVSPQPKKDDGNKEEKKPDKEKPQDSETKPEKKPKEKPKGTPVTTEDLKVQVNCHCDGCIDKIRKIVAETKVKEFKVDKQKELVTVKGTMDVNALAKALKDKLKKNVEIVPPKKVKDGKNEGGENGGGGGKKKKRGDGGNDQANTGGDKVEGNRMDLMPQQYFVCMPVYPGYMLVHPYGHPSYGYGYGQMDPYSVEHGHGYGYEQNFVVCFFYFLLAGVSALMIKRIV